MVVEWWWCHEVSCRMSAGCVIIKGVPIERSSHADFAHATLLLKASLQSLAKRVEGGSRLPLGRLIFFQAATYFAHAYNRFSSLFRTRFLGFSKIIVRQV